MSQEDSDEEEHTSGSVKRMKEFVNNISDEEIKTAIDMIRNAEETYNHAQGLISNNTDFRSANVETFLFDSGASVSLMGEQIARENNLTIKRLDKPRNVHEASGAKLDIIGSCDMYIKLKVLGKTKHLRCLILRGRNVDREVLISCKMLKSWDLIHPTFHMKSWGRMSGVSISSQTGLQPSMTSQKHRQKSASARFLLNVKNLKTKC